MLCKFSSLCYAVEAFDHDLVAYEVDVCRSRVFSNSSGYPRLILCYPRISIQGSPEVRTDDGGYCEGRLMKCKKIRPDLEFSNDRRGGGRLPEMICGTSKENKQRQTRDRTICQKRSGEGCWIHELNYGVFTRCRESEKTIFEGLLSSRSLTLN